MTLSIESRKSVDAYLAALRRQLRDLLDEDVKDIVEEIRMHILDKTAEDCSQGAVAAALAALGNPEELAARYRTEELLQRAKLSRTPAYMLHSLLHWALLSVLGLLVFSISVLGYVLGGGLFILGVLKVFNYQHTGLWGVFTEHEWSLGFQSGGEHGGHELLGVWLLPLGLLGGPVLFFLTLRFGMWSVRKFWRPRAWR